MKINMALVHCVIESNHRNIIILSTITPHWAFPPLMDIELFTVGTITNNVANTFL